MALGCVSSHQPRIMGAGTTCMQPWWSPCDARETPCNYTTHNTPPHAGNDLADRSLYGCTYSSLDSANSLRTSACGVRRSVVVVDRRDLIPSTTVTVLIIRCAPRYFAYACIYVFLSLSDRAIEAWFSHLCRLQTMHNKQNTATL